jgi:flagellar biosynthesis protein
MTEDTQKKAATLKYDPNKTAAPRLTAKGKGWLADKILELAKEHDIPIKQDRDLVNILETLELDQEIPLEIYAVVAEIFSYLYRTGQAKQAQT